MAQYNETLNTSNSMKFLREIKGVTLLDRMPNEVIKSEIVNTMIAEKQLVYWGYMQRMEATRTVKNLSTAKVQGPIARGRSSTVYSLRKKNY